MTDGVKATKVLDYLESLDSRTIINILDSLLDDYQLALLYDDLHDEGLI